MLIKPMNAVKTFLIIWACLVIVYSKAQNTSEQHRQLLSGETFRYYYQQYNGKPYFTDDWFEATLELQSGDIYQRVKLNFDIHNDDILYYHPDLKRIVILDPPIIKKIRFIDPKTGDSLCIIRLSNTSHVMLPPGYCFLLVEGPVSLIMKSSKLIEQYSSAPPVDKKLGQFYMKTDYYFVKNNKYVHVPLRKRTLAKLFPEKQEQILQLFASQRLSLKTRSDVQRVFTEINKLMVN